MSESVVMDVELKSPIARVWQALTDSDLLSTWMLFKTNTFQPVVGHAFQFRDAPGYDGTVDCTVTEVDEPHRLSYSWTAVGVDNQPHTTTVTWTLTEADGVTQVHLEHSDFRSGADQEVGGATYAWTNMLAELGSVLVPA